MKLATLFAVALTAVAPALAVPAAAQHTVVTHRTVVHRDGPATHVRKVCRTEYRHHHRIRTCRTVRR